MNTLFKNNHFGANFDEKHGFSAQYFDAFWTHPDFGPF